MSQTKSPNGTFPDFPFQLGTNGQFITEDDLCVSDTTGKGWIGKLIDAVGWLKDRAGYTALITTDGVGGCAVVWQSKTTADADWITSVNDDTTSGIVVTMSSAAASTNAYTVRASLQRLSNEVTLSSKRYPIVVQDASGLDKFVVQIVDDGGTAINTSTVAVRVFIRMVPQATL